jgi:ElaB/YqjD/DUF883 family membrane-anchored ribosome-binding protein
MQERIKRMETVYCTTNGQSNSIVGLIKELTVNTKTFFRQELELAKTEISEKISAFGKNAVSIAIGGFVAFIGAMLLLVGLGFLASFGFEKMGLDRLMAAFAGFGSLGLLVTIVGAIFIMKALSGFKKESLVPSRTIYTLQELKGEPAPLDLHARKPEKDKEEHKPSSEDLQARVEETEERMGEALDELGKRLSPSYINFKVKHKIRENPYPVGFAAMGVGVLSGLLIRNKMRKHNVTD